MKDYNDIYDTENFHKQYYYQGNDLGANYTSEKTIFKVWSPLADKVLVLLYDKSQSGKPFDKLKMAKGEKGIWEVSVEQDLHGVYYQYQISNSGKSNVTGDPYAKACGVNGERSMVVDLEKTNPIGWENDTRPEFDGLSEAIIYETHVRDITNHYSSGVEHKGKYLGLTETDTKSPEGLSTGLSHIKELGITHVHLLPVFDYGSINENDLDKPQFNWGYDPVNYNVPEGSYSTNPIDGEVRIKEFKQMVMAMHKQGLRVVMDVVYNHTHFNSDSWFHKTVPGYYHRTKGGKFTNGSGCNNETASERPMVRDYIVNSVKYWADEYHIDGFRFDLMGLHDLETMKDVRHSLDEIDSSIIIYGEGWIANEECQLPINKRASKANVSKLPGIAVFNDDCRDGVKGHVFFNDAPGFINGGTGFEESIKYSIVGACNHDQIDYNEVIYSKKSLTKDPRQIVNYVSCHDNLTLFDKIIETTKGLEDKTRIKMHKLANCIVLTSQGIPFLHSGVEFVRTKHGDHNSYKSPDSINNIDWHFKYDHKDVYDYYKGLIELRKNHPAFKMKSEAKIREHIHFLPSPVNTVAYNISNQANGDKWTDITVIFNASTSEVKFKLPHFGLWKVVVNGESAGVETLHEFISGEIVVPELTTMVLYSNEKLMNKVEVVQKKSNDTSKVIKTVAAGVVGVWLLSRMVKKRKK